MNHRRARRLAHSLIRTAALEDRVNLLTKKYPQVPAAQIQEMVKSDPTGGKALEWIVSRTKSGNIRWPEDAPRVEEALKTFFQLKRSPALLKRFGLNPDLNKYDLHSLETATDKATGKEIKTQRQTVEEAKQEGAQLVYDQPPLKVIRIGGPDLDKAAQAACTYAKGTKWCTSQKETAKFYLKNDPLYIIFQNGEKRAQYHEDAGQLMDLQDKPIFINDDPELYTQLYKAGIFSSKFYLRAKIESIPRLQLTPEEKEQVYSDPKAMLAYVQNHRDFDKARAEAILAQDAETALEYAQAQIFQPFPAGEPAIARNPKTAYEYARHVLRKPFPAGEPYIAQDPKYAYFYAKDVLLGERFPAGEPAIAQSSLFAYEYATQILHGRFPAGEPAIIQDGDKQGKYALLVLRRRWPEAEAYLKEHPGHEGKRLKEYERYVNGIENYDFHQSTPST